jgi:N-6 DNA Methylase
METESNLIAMCCALIRDLDSLSAPERRLLKTCGHILVEQGESAAVKEAIRSGGDPLGDAFLRIRSSLHRRADGAVYTPHPIVESMMSWLSSQATPARILDPGAGSGRFVMAAGKKFSHAELVGVETDPLAALMMRANLEAHGWTDRATVLVQDYRDVKLPACAGITAFIGNPPYVRHHDIGAVWKSWYAKRFADFGIKASGLAGLHLHFFLQTRLLANKGDIGAFITSAEWLDVNYGSALRQLLINELGGLALHVLAPTVEAFPGTATTAAITCFRVGETRAPLIVRSVQTLDLLNGLSKGIEVTRDRFQIERRWSIIVRPSIAQENGDIELGELFRVHRGQVTGANNIWIAGEHADELPDSVKIVSVTRAKDLISAGDNLSCTSVLRRVVDIPADLDQFDQHDRLHVTHFLAWARAQGADQSYTAQHRRAWWSVGLKAPAPILCTYMARRPPQFTLNACGARHINIAHGLYPRQQFSSAVLMTLVAWLNKNVSTDGGRTYSGGLTKFEPKEIERLLIPRIEDLAI